MASRHRNEQEFQFWQDLPDGRRRYWNERTSPTGERQHLVKTVDTEDATLQIVQEIYDDQGKLVEWHQKYPFDSGPHTMFRDDDTQRGARP